MKVLIQWSQAEPKDWQEVDSASWALLPSKSEPVGGETIDNSLGWVTAINIQGCVYKGFDHYAVEDLSLGRCRLICWNDDPVDWPGNERHAIIHTFAPLQPDSLLGNAINTKQTREVFATGTARTRLLTNAPTDTFSAWSKFIPPAAALIRHGIWLSDLLFAAHTAMRSRIGWRERPWTDHLAVDEVDVNGRLLSQRSKDRWQKAQGTITYYCRDTYRAAAYELFVEHEDALETSTATATTETVEVPLDTTEKVWAFTSDTNTPNSSDWPNGSYRIQYDVTVIDSGVRIDNTLFSRIIADGTSVLESAQDLTDVTTTGLAIRSATWNPAAGSSSDRFAVRVSGTNFNTMMGDPATITLELNTVDSFADGPWTAGGRTTKNTRAFPLGMDIGAGMWVHG